jgi:outer membrane cobalamin receptor
LYLYRNDLTNGEKFNVVYDQGNVTRTSLFGEIGFSSADKVKMLARLDLFGYSAGVEAEAWHRPTYRFAFTSSYNLYNKFLFDVDMLAQGGMKALSIDQKLANTYTYKIVTIGAAFDLNVKASYLVSNQFSVFFKASNVFNNQYQQYLYYQVRGTQFLLGAAYGF